MGDLRNKLAKQAWREALRKLQSRHKAHGGPPPPIACWCGLNDRQTEIILRYDRSGVVTAYCRPHWPVECACWELATRFVDGQPMCERCYQRANRKGAGR